jgi:putative transposase
MVCGPLGVSQSWFYKWVRGDVSRRRQRRRRLAAEIVRLFGLHRGRYGLPRITDDLIEAGWQVSTEIETGEGKLHLASVIDIFARRVVGFAVSEHHDAELAYAALAMAVAVRGGQVKGVIMHTDLGSEGVHRRPVPGGLHTVGCAPVHGPGRLGAGQRCHRVLALYNGV